MAGFLSPDKNPALVIYMKNKNYSLVLICPQKLSPSPV